MIIHSVESRVFDLVASHIRSGLDENGQAANIQTAENQAKLLRMTEVGTNAANRHLAEIGFAAAIEEEENL